MEEKEQNNNPAGQGRLQPQDQNSPEPAPTTDHKADQAEGDLSQHKALAIVGYIIPLLFFLPLVTDSKDSQFAKFHANQQLNILLLLIAGQVIGRVLTIIEIGVLILLLMPIVWIVYMIIGIINVSNEEVKPLPLIGKFELLK